MSRSHDKSTNSQYKGTTKSDSNSELLLEARPSQRVGSQRIEGDGDTWQETLAVCEAPSVKSKNLNMDMNMSTSGKLIIRSYFQNIRSGKRVWDEPPSGASMILPATEEMRRMAEVQLAELHIVTGQTQAQTQTQTQVQSQTPMSLQTETKEPKKRRSLFGFGKKKEKVMATSPQAKIRYKPGSSLLTTPPRMNIKGVDTDAQLQEAIARSLAESQGIPYQYQSTIQPMDDDELAMAKALSLSAAHESGETEEQLLAQVLEESRIEDAMKRGAYHAALSEPEDMDDLLDWKSDDRKPAALPLSELKQAPTYSQEPVSPSISAVVFANPGTSPFAATSTPTSSGKSPPRSPVSPLFDPYAKDATSPASRVPPEKPPVSSLQKMDPNTTASRLNWGKRTSQKIKDEAGLV